ATAQELGVDEGAIWQVDVAQQATKAVRFADVLDQNNRLPLHQLGIGGGGFGIEGHVTFGCIDANVAHSLGATVQLHVDGVAVDDFGDGGLVAIGRGGESFCRGGPCTPSDSRAAACVGNWAL